MPADRIDQAVRRLSPEPVVWRLDILTTCDDVPRSYTMLVSGLGGGRKRLQELVGELQSQ